MKNSEKELKQIKDLYNVEGYDLDKINEIVKHRYWVECNLNMTELNYEEWLKEIASLDVPISDWWEYTYGLWHFSGELEHYCEQMSFSDAVYKVTSEYINK